MVEKVLGGRAYYYGRNIVLVVLSAILASQILSHYLTSDRAATTKTHPSNINQPTHQLHSIAPHAIYSTLDSPHSPLPYPSRLQTSTQRPKTHQSSTAQHEHHAERRPELPNRVLHLLERYTEVCHDETGGQEEDGEFREEQGNAGEVLNVE